MALYKDFSEVPAIVTVTNNTDRKVKFGTMNAFTQSVEIPANSSIKLKAETSAELVYFYAQASEAISVEHEAVTAEEG